MHAAALADRLGVEHVVVPPTEGVLSAFGLLAADESHDAVRTYRTRLAETDPHDVDAVYGDLAGTVLEDATDPAAATVERAVDCRYAGQSFEVTVPAPDPFDPATVTERFHEAHERVRGYRMAAEPVDVVTLRVSATVPGEKPSLTYDPTGDPRVGRRDTIFALEGKNSASGAAAGESRVAGVPVHETPVYDRGRVPPGGTYHGPAVFEGGESTVVCPPGWTTSVAGDGTLTLEVDV
jgi:N-methylhydantoinase A